MRIADTAIPGIKILTPQRHEDERGYFAEVWRQDRFAEAGIPGPFVQDNHALSRRAGTVRGLHYQLPPRAQGKLVRVVRGRVYDVAVDVRRGSPDFGRHVAATLDAAEGNQLWIPPGFAHGYCTLEDDCELLYKVTDFYSPDDEAGILWNDAALAIDWPVGAAWAEISGRDRALPPLAEQTRLFEPGPT
ncbi:dTDP-4-dehydrorhamnose 3,5-epimerase [Oceanibacterium hippocampi]|uniref:dTDP-4-dehydrorhamnose 3,5-epimerase n=1 Tax=Oceanibacterium hippocampi TaxID=745714 RepID=A0A1Y5TUU3_9PROT|nr:dTDP-4-dehydrorhamnose 3,5-epimerase [Oceanibacterium hippocampi]SLN73566.1 dTDP-4-dehydrorhamnose 3,5-epimerase [Oceanibacterium hippocampi]